MCHPLSLNVLLWHIPKQYEETTDTFGYMLQVAVPGMWLPVEIVLRADAQQHGWLPL